MRGYLFRGGVARWLLCAGVLVGVLALSAPAGAEEPNRDGKANARPQLACAPLDAMRKRLEKRYGETLRAVGILSESVALNVYASERGTFTVLLITAKGTACVQSVGKNFTWRSKPIAGRDA